MNLTLWLLAAYLCLLPLLGLWGRKLAREASLKDYYLAGGAISTVPLLFTLYATQYSGNTLLGFAGSAYRDGVVILFSALGMAAVIAMYATFAKPLHHLAQTRGLLTIADYLHLRYNNKTLVRLANLLLVLTLASYILTNFKAAGLLLETLSGDTIPLLWGILGLAFVMAIYESLGGMRSVVMTDILQGVLLLAGCLLVMGLVVAHFGGFAPLLAQLQSTPAEGWRELDTRQWMRGVSITMLFGIAICIYPHSIQRIYAAKSWSSLKRSFFAMALMPLITTAPIVLAALAATLIIPDLSRAQSDQVIPQLLSYFMTANPAFEILLAVFLVAALAAIMSTIDSALLSLGSIFTHDIFRKIAPATSEQKLTQFSKVAVWLLMFASAALAIALPQTIWELLVIKLQVMVQITPALVLGIRLPNLRAPALTCGMITGLIVTFWFQYGTWGVPDLYGFHAGIWGFFANLLAIVLVHRLDKKRGF